MSIAKELWEVALNSSKQQAINEHLALSEGKDQIFNLDKDYSENSDQEAKRSHSSE